MVAHNKQVEQFAGRVLLCQSLPPLNSIPIAHPLHAHSQEYVVLGGQAGTLYLSSGRKCASEHAVKMNATLIAIKLCSLLLDKMIKIMWTSLRVS